MRISVARALRRRLSGTWQHQRCALELLVLPGSSVVSVPARSAAIAGQGGPP